MSSSAFRRARNPNDDNRVAGVGEDIMTFRLHSLHSTQSAPSGGRWRLSGGDLARHPAAIEPPHRPRAMAEERSAILGAGNDHDVGENVPPDPEEAQPPLRRLPSRAQIVEEQILAL